MNKLSTSIAVHEPRIAKKIAGFTSFVCRFVSPVHRWTSAVCSGEYEAVALMFLGASFGVLRSLDVDSTLRMIFQSKRLTEQCNHALRGRKIYSREVHTSHLHRMVS